MPANNEFVSNLSCCYNEGTILYYLTRTQLQLSIL
jgi:hypothetical protein